MRKFVKEKKILKLVTLANPNLTLLVKKAFKML